VYGQRLILKIFRRLSEGTNPDLEIGRFLTERARFPHIPSVAGALEYRAGEGEPTTLGILQAYVVNEGDAWSYTLDQLERYFECVLTIRSELGDFVAPTGSPLDPTGQHSPFLVLEMASHLETARLLGQRTAEVHLALAAETEDPAFAPEPFAYLYQRSLYQSMRTSTLRNFEVLRERLGDLSGPSATEATALLALEGELLETFRGIVGDRLAGMRIRSHGDYHLAQVLHTGTDLVIIDFEGEPARPLSERRLKQSPLRDVAGMLRSFDYAAYTALFSSAEKGVIREEDVAVLEPWARFWRQWMSSAFLRAYLPPVSGAGLVPADPDPLGRLLRVFLLDKAVYELGYELNSRPSWARIPIRGILDLLRATG